MPKEMIEKPIENVLSHEEFGEGGIGWGGEGWEIDVSWFLL